MHTSKSHKLKREDVGFFFLPGELAVTKTIPIKT